jgi:hypothetical protein
MGVVHHCAELIGRYHTRVHLTRTCSSSSVEMVISYSVASCALLNGVASSGAVSGEEVREADSEVLGADRVVALEWKAADLTGEWRQVRNCLFDSSDLHDAPIVKLSASRITNWRCWNEGIGEHH